MGPERPTTGEFSGKLIEVTGWDHHKTIFVACLFVISAVVLKIVYHRTRLVANFIPESCVFILFGSAIDYLWSETSAAVARLKPTFTIDIFFAILLPPIMLESAYSLNQKYFYLNIVPVLMYAVIGTVLNIAAIGPSLYAVEQLDGRKWLNIPNVSLLELTIFGASLSAIDPVSVLAIFKDLRVKRSLYYLVFGESLLNDAVVLVIHRILLDMLDADRQAFSVRVLLLGLAKFVIVSCGSLLIGMLLGAISSLLTLATKHVEDIEPILLLVLAYAAYVSAEIFEWSGVVSIIGCGLVQAEFALRNISSRSRITVHNYIKTLSATSDGIIFIFIGMVMVQTKHYWNVAFILLTLAFCIVYRLLSVLSLTYIVNHVIAGATYVSLREQLLMVHGGLRGAIAYILISMLGGKEQSQQHKGSKNVTATGRVGTPTQKATGPWHGSALATDTAHSNRTENWSLRPGIQLLQTTTLCVILVTVFIMGSTTKPLLKYLQIKREVDTHSSTIFSQLNDQMLDDTSEFIRRIVSDKSSQTCLYRTARWLNQRFLRRIFVRKSKCIHEDCGKEEDEDDSDDGDEEPLINAKTRSATVGRSAVAAQRQEPLTVPSLAVTVATTPYECILRNHLAKQLRHKAKSMTLLGTKQSSGTRNIDIGDHSWGSPDHSSKSNGREILSGRKEMTQSLRRRYEYDAQSITANQHSQPNRVNISTDTPERVIVEDLKPLSLLTTQRRLNSSQQWRWVRVDGQSGSDQRQRTTEVQSQTSAWPYLPNSRSALTSGPQSEHNARVARQSLTELQATRLPTANGLPRHNVGAKFQLLPQFDPLPSHKSAWKRYRDTALPYNLSARSDT